MRGWDLACHLLRKCGLWREGSFMCRHRASLPGRHRPAFFAPAQALVEQRGYLRLWQLCLLKPPGSLQWAKRQAMEEEAVRTCSPLKASWEPSVFAFCFPGGREPLFLCKARQKVWCERLLSSQSDSAISQKSQTLPLWLGSPWDTVLYHSPGCGLILHYLSEPWCLHQ